METSDPLNPEQTIETSKMDETIVAVTECLRIPKNRGMSAIHAADKELILYFTRSPNISRLLSDSGMKE
ncbi:hypothetical protein D3C74_495210 [compost metagenome]